MKRRILLAWCWSIGLVRAEQPVDLVPVEKWIARAAGVKTVVAEFRQERQLRTLKKPLETTGKVWVSLLDGGLRMETGVPARVIAVLPPKGDLTLLDVEKKEAQIVPRAGLERERAGQALSFVMAGFPKDLASFQERFEITAVVPEQEWHRIELKPRGAGKSIAVLKVILMVEQSSHKLAALHVMLRDGSRIGQTFTDVRENAAIQPSIFAVDTAGYRFKK
jgi:hypothetical protein